MIHPLTDICYTSPSHLKTGVGRPSPSVFANVLAQGLGALRRQRELRHTPSQQIVAVLSFRDEINAPIRVHT